MCRAFQPWVDRNALNYTSIPVESGRRWVRTEVEVLRQFEKSPDFRSAWAKIAHGIGN